MQKKERNQTQCHKEEILVTKENKNEKLYGCTKYFLPVFCNYRRRKKKDFTSTSLSPAVEMPRIRPIDNQMMIIKKSERDEMYFCTHGQRAKK